MAALNRRGLTALVAGGLLLSSAPAIAQNSTTVANDPATGLTTNTVDPAYNATSTTVTSVTNDTQVAPVREERDRDFPWGLLGLLGLAGLLGRKKQDDIHVDARHDRRNV
jgi:hypothetical protein